METHLMTSTVVSGVWRSHAALDESEADSSPEAPQQFKKIRSSSSLNSLRMSLRKRLPLKPVQSNINISENPTWESLQNNQKTSAVRKLTRSAKNSFGNVYQKIQRRRQPQECLVMTPGRTSDGEDCFGTSQTPKRSAARTTITPRRTPGSSSRRTPRGARTPKASDSAVRTVKTRGTRRQLVRMAALRSPYASPNTVNSRRQFDEDLDCVSNGLRGLKRLSQAFDDAIWKDDRARALEHYKAVMNTGCSSAKSHLSRGMNRASIRKQSRRIRQTLSSWTDEAMANVHKAL